MWFRLGRLRFGPTVCLALALASVTGIAADAASSAAAGQIASQARYWEQKGRFDLARESWLKLLRAEPDNAAALAGLAAAEIRSGRPEMAKQYLQGLRAIDPNHPELRRVESMVAADAVGAPDLARARELARAGRNDEAVAEYRRVFGGEAPSGSTAMEYWQTLAGAEGGWAESRKGLERLVKDHPGNTDYRLALAQHLTYREETRRQGLDQLIELADRDDGRQPVQQIWRQALLWMSGRGADERYFQAYLSRYGQDTQVSSRLAAARSGSGGGGVAGGSSSPPRVDVRGRDLKRAWALLDAGKVDEAEKAFGALRKKNPRDADALGGLGVIRLRQDRFADARALLEAAARSSPGRWSGALATARFWEQVRLAESDRKAGRNAEAERKLRQAISSAPGIAAKEPSVRLSLADTLVALNRPGEAEGLYRGVLQQNPGNTDAARGLIGVLAQTGRVGDALVLYRKLTPEQQAKVGSVGSLQSLALRQQAAGALALGDESGAERLLKEALTVDPQSTWPRLDLARLYLAQNRRNDARSLIDGLPVSGPLRGEGSYIRALMATEEQNWYDGLMWLEQVPEAERTAEMAAVQQRMWVRYQTERAAVYARQGHRDEALALLSGVEPYARSPELLGSVAFAYSEAGEQGRALYLLRQELARKPTPELQLAYAGLLLKLGQHAEFDAQIDQLARRPKLSPQQEETLIEMRIAQRLRQADALRQSDNVARAYELLEPALRANPDDPRLIMALAGLYSQAGEQDRATSLYRYALKLDARNLEAYQGMVQTSLATGREDEADRWLAEALRIAPDSSRLHVLAGRVAKARGQDGRALQLFRRALELGPGSDGPAQGRGPLRLQFVDTHLRPVSMASAPAASARSAVRGDYSIGPAARRGGLIKVAEPKKNKRRQVAQEDGTSLPPLPPPGYRPPALVSPPSGASTGTLKLDVPRTFLPPPLGPEPLNLRVDPVLRSRDYAYRQSPIPSTPGDDILREIAALEDKRGAWAAAGVGLRNRDGQSGLDRLDDIEMPMEVSFAGAQAGRMNLRLVPVYLDAGRLSGAELPLFGTLALADTTGLSFDQNEQGIAFGFSYEIGKLIVDIGTTPLGFEVGNGVGGIRWAPQVGKWTFEADISRRPVTDSLLSYAGVRDPLTGREFGGVTATGGRLDVAYDLDDVGLYANAGFHVYEGENTADNQEVSVGGGVYKHLYRSAISRVTAGVNITSFYFDENLRRFTFGHGGYFSPQRYLSFAIPLEWVGGHNRFSWKLNTAIGLQNFHEDGAALYPDDSDLQAQVSAAAVADPAIPAGYESQSSTGMGLTFGGMLEYLIAPRLVVGARAAFDNARDYDETRVQAYLRWTWSSRNAVAVPPRPVQTFAEYGHKP